MKIAIVPLDDRPCNLRFPSKIAAHSNFRVLTPPKDILGRFTHPGDTRKICEWAKDVSAAADGMIISSEMLCYGGLVASRSARTSLEAALSKLETVAEIKKAKPSLAVFLSSVIMRLSVTADSESGKKHWENIFRYSELADKAERFKREEDIKELDRISSEIPSSMMEDYLYVRDRNHKVNARCVELVDQGDAEYLVLSKEDCAEFGVHRAEERKLTALIGQKGVGKRVQLTNGADEVAGVLLARFYLRNSISTPRIFAVYSAGSGEEMSLYEDSPLKEVVSSHIKAAGAHEAATAKEATHILAVNSFQGRQMDLFFEEPLEESGGALGAADLCRRLEPFVSEGKKIALADVRYANGGDKAFADVFLSHIGMDRLAGYAGWNTSGNSIGSAITQAVFPKNKEFILERFIDDIGYQSEVRRRINSLLQERGASKFNLEGRHLETEKAAAELLGAWAERFMKKAGITGYSFKCALPWPRTFEIDCDIIPS